MTCGADTEWERTRSKWAIASKRLVEPALAERHSGPEGHGFKKDFQERFFPMEDVNYASLPTRQIEKEVNEGEESAKRWIQESPGVNLLLKIAGDKACDKARAMSVIILSNLIIVGMF